MTYLSRMMIDARQALEQRFLDLYAWHKGVWGCFPDQPEANRDFLFRLDEREGGFTLWILSERAPTKPAWCMEEDFAVRRVAESFLGHGCYAFDVVVNPTRRLVVRDETGGKKKNGRRVALHQPAEITSWFERKAAAAGVRLRPGVPLDIGATTEFHFHRKEAHGKHGGVRLRGVLEVVEPLKFREAYHHGIGTAKSFGFGLLLLSPVHPTGEKEK